jgi:hypothetical protein
MEKCPHCSAQIDRQAAAAAAEAQSRVNQACSDASYLRTAAVGMWVFLGVSFIPFMPLVFWGFLATFVLVLVMFIRWQVKFGGLKTNDPDYGQAKRAKNLALILWLAVLVTWFVILPMIRAAILS